MRIATEYSAPEFEIIECVAEHGFSLSTGGGTEIPDFDTENEL